VDSTDVNNQQQNMRLRSAFLHWIGCVAAFVLLVAIASKFDSSMFGTLAFFFYFGAGIYLNRGVLRRIIEWHPMYSTLHNVTSAKLQYFFLWPITYFFLFIRLGINRLL